MNLAMRVSPERLFWTFFSCDVDDHAAEDDFGLVGCGGQVGDAVGRQRLEQVGVARQGMARHVEAQGLLLEGQLLGIGQLGQVGQTARAPRCVAVAVGLGLGAVAGAVEDVEEAELARACDPPAWPARPGAPWAGSARSCDRRAPRQSKAPAWISVSTQPAPTSLVETRSKKSSRLRNGPCSSRALTIASTALNPTPLIAPSPKWIFPPRRPGTSSCPSLMFGGSTSIPIRRQSSMCSTKNLSRSEPSISEESTAAMNSVG